MKTTSAIYFLSDLICANLYYLRHLRQLFSFIGCADIIPAQ